MSEPSDTAPVDQSDVQFAIERLYLLIERSDIELSVDEQRALTHLKEVGDYCTWMMPGWPPGQEQRATQALNAIAPLINRLGRPSDDYDDRAPSPVPELFHVSELMDIAPWNGGSLELWRTRRIRFWGVGTVSADLFLARLDAEAEPGPGRRYDTGWHIHPMDHNGQHLGYKCLFDANHRQGDLSWELHSKRGKKTPWGDPSRTVLPSGTAEKLHQACLAAVLRQSSLRGRFSEWASLFQRPSGTDAFVARPAPDSPVPWDQNTNQTPR